MEDDEEIKSHQSSGSRSPESPLRNRRITVTVAAAPPQNTLTLALPIQQPRGGGGGGVREDCWSEGATAVLIDAWGERYLELSRGNLKQTHWKEVADIVRNRDDYKKAPKTDIQCKNRIDTVKKKYKLEKAKIASGGGPSKWLFFDRLDQLIRPTAKATNTPLKAVPVGVGLVSSSVPQFQKQKSQAGQIQSQRLLNRRRPPPADSESSSDSEPPEPSSDSEPPPETNYKRARVQNPNPRGELGGKEKKNNNWGNSARELARAILKFGEAYEQAESSKLQQLVEMEKQRMKFAKELELQRMQFFMKTQLELSQLKQHRSVGNNNSNHHHHHRSSSNNNVNNNLSDNSNN